MRGIKHLGRSPEAPYDHEREGVIFFDGEKTGDIKRPRRIITGPRLLGMIVAASLITTPCQNISEPGKSDGPPADFNQPLQPEPSPQLPELPVPERDRIWS
ncbi:hypothetical protein KY385_03810 [Candidatus Parcubacteria bacterium]|nr:hypothetical protein [Candidatus Parcubacteria bacterium]